MRKIKMRFWDRELEKYNFLNLHDLGEPDEYWYDGETTVWDALYDATHEQKRFIVEQYTGINDSFGNEIYEGDILKISDGVHTTFEEVYYGVDKGENYPAYTITNLEWKFSANPFSELLDSTTDYEFVVVGNIHENPEITGGKRK